MRQSQVILQILSISLILNSALSSDFSRFISQDEVIKVGVGELQLIMEGFDWSSIIDSTEKWNYTESGHAYDSYLAIDSFNLTGYKIDTAQLRGDLDGQLIIKSDAKPTIDLVFEFRYLGRTTYTSKFVGTGKVRITDEGFNFRKGEKADGSVDTELQLVLNVNIDINGTKDDTLMSYFSKIKSDHSDLIKPRVIRLLNEFIQDFYKKVKDTTITFETTSPNFNYSYTFGFSQPPVYTQTVGVTYYYKGNLKRIKTPALKFLVGDDEYTFNPKDGNKQAFINYASLKSLFTDFSTTDKLQFDVNEKTKIPEFKFLLNIDFLGQIVPAIYNTKARDERIHIKTSLTDISFDHTTKTLSANAKFEIYDSKEVNIFSWNNALKLNVVSQFDQKQVSLNFSFKSVSIADTTVTVNSFGPADEQTLSNWVRDSFESVFAKYITSLFKASINLSSFLTVSSVVEKQNGLLIIG